MTVGPVVFMGTPLFSVPFLDAIIKSKREIALVITQPDKPKGRGQKLMPPPVKEFAMSRNIPVLQPEKLSEASVAETIRGLNPEFIVVVAYGKIIPSQILKIPVKGCINVHASILPEFRGASPIQWAVINGRTLSGVTTMLMDETLDTGDILLQETVEIDRTDTAGSLGVKLSEIGPGLLIKTLGRLEMGAIIPIPQDHEKASYAPLIKKEDGIINWKESSEHIYNKIRGFDPWPGVYTFYKGKRWGIWKAEVKDTTIPTAKPGEVTDINPDGIVVAAGKGAVNITEIQPEGKRRMRVDEYLRGHKLEKGIVLGDETRDIDSA